MILFVLKLEGLELDYTLIDNKELAKLASEYVKGEEFDSTGEYFKVSFTKEVFETLRRGNTHIKDEPRIRDTIIDVSRDKNARPEDTVSFEILTSTFNIDKKIFDMVVRKQKRTSIWSKEFQRPAAES